ncbi:MAG: ABC transporter substrate-binding protein [Pseudomonadota bacterium]
MTRFKPTRRHLLASMAAAALPGRGSSDEGLTLYGAPIAVSLPLAHLVDRDGLAPIITGLRFHKWSSPDEMRAGVASGAIEVTTAPAPTAANLYNRGLGMRLLGVLTTGMLYLMTTDATIERVEDLAGKRVLVPFRGDMPDRIFTLIARERGIPPDAIDVEYTATPIEAAQLMLAGRAPAAVLQEPAATASVMRGLSESVRVNRALDLQALYAEATGGPPDIPQAVMILRDGLRERLPDLAPRLLSEIRRSTDWVRSNPASAGRLGADYMGLPKPVLERAIPGSNLEARSAVEARPALEGLYRLLAETNPALIGGGLPDDGFYLDASV